MTSASLYSLFPALYSLFPALLLCNLASAQLLPDNREAHHKLIFENHYIRLLEGRVPDHDTTLPHTHTANSVVVFLSQSIFGIQPIGGQAVINHVSPGDLKYVDYGDRPVYHIVWNQSDPGFHFLVVELAKKPQDKDTCPVITQPGVKFQWKHALVNAYEVELAAGDTCRLPASNGGRLVIAIAGNSLALSAGVNHLLLPDGFVFVSPHKKMEIAAGSQTAARCILLEIQ
jgi:hypothetical protein